MILLNVLILWMGMELFKKKFIELGRFSLMAIVIVISDIFSLAVMSLRVIVVLCVIVVLIVMVCLVKVMYDVFELFVL